MSGYQSQSAQVISDLMDNFTEPAHIPALAEMCSNMLVLSAANNFETTMPRKKYKQKKGPHFSPEHKAAYLSHDKICKELANSLLKHDICPN